ncbi:radical SAM/SPASM domain-containing protein [Pseudodesulfovibrio sp.]|uniref:radical SAM/SPASM domain-containing protein n=1 Tax=unclassified Pseudodesulfovibrio TaxID=2661612 RepID=UPI003AFFDDA7
MTKVNVDQFVLGSRKKELMWNLIRRHPAAFWINRAQWYLYPKLKYTAAFPIHVDFEASSLCNMRCPMCFRPHRADKSDGNMDFDMYCKAIDECATHGLYSIRLSWRGEPSMNPQFVEMVRYARQAGIKEISTLTNGLKIEAAYAEDLVRAGIDYLSISIDGLHADYDRIRKPAKFEETVERIRNLRRLRDSIGGGFPRIKVNTIWSQVKNNADEYYGIFGPLADIISFNPDYDYSEEACPVPADHCCQYPFQRLSVKWNGDVPMCISDWDAEEVLGNIGRESLKSIWDGEKMRRIRKDHATGNALNYSPCRKCHRPVTEQVGNQRMK